MKKAVSLIGALAALVLAVGSATYLSSISFRDPVSIVGTYLEADEMTPPGNPSANKLRLYGIDDGGTTKLAYRDSAGAQTVLDGGAGFVAGGYSGATTGTTTTEATLETVAIPGSALSADSVIRIEATWVRNSVGGGTGGVGRIYVAGTELTSGTAVSTQAVSWTHAVVSAVDTGNLVGSAYTKNTTTNVSSLVQSSIVEDITDGVTVDFRAILNDSSASENMQLRTFYVEVLK